MLYITGDCHSDFTRFSAKQFPQQRELTKGDYVLICGDFGGVWNGSREEEHWLDWLEEKPFTTLFLTGNHENFDLLQTYPQEPWNGGLIRRIRPSVAELCRGHVFRLDGRRTFVMGGAASHNMPDGLLRQGPCLKRQRRLLDRRRARYRVEHESWWAQELPEPREYQTALAALEQEQWIVDLVATHCAPTAFHRALAPGLPADTLTDFLDEVRGRLLFRQWYCGHYHCEREWANERFQTTYQSILPVP